MFGRRPKLSEGDVLLIDDERVCTVAHVGQEIRDRFGYGYASEYEYYVTVRFEDDTRRKYSYPDWSSIEGCKVFDDNLKLGDVVEVKPVDDEATVELDRNPRGKIIGIDKENLRRPYVIRSADGGHELSFSRKEFVKVLSATSYEKRGETIKTLDAQIKKFDEKIANLTAQRDALKVAREVMDYVVT